jgi:putative NADH-flavin reductase
MKLLVFDASGGTGTLVVQQALKKNYEVTAFVHNPEKLKIVHPNLKIVRGDVLQQSTIDEIISGHDAVICCLGSPATKVGKLRSDGTRNIVNSMRQHNMSRFVCQTSLGYGDSKIVLDYTPFVFRKIIVPYLLKKTFDDHLLQETYIKQSSLDWVIVRPGSMTNGKFTGSYRHDFAYSDHTLKVKISRADVADFLIEQATSNENQKKVIGISY